MVRIPGALFDDAETRSTPALWVLVGISILVVAIAAPALAASAEVQIVRSSAQSQRIEGLAFPADPLQPLYEVGHGSRNTYVRLTGVLRKANTSLVWAGKPVVLGPRSGFVIEVPLTNAATFVDLTSIGIRGETTKERVTLVFKEINAWIAENATGSIAAPERDPSWRLSVGVGATDYAFQQTNIQEFKQMALSAKIGGVWAPSRWELSGNFYFTSILFNASREGVSVLPYGVNARGGYRIPFNDRWSLTLSAGYYLSSMNVSNHSFGYEELSGPELYPLLRYRFGDSQFLSAYGKYSPVSNGFGVTSLTNRELAGGLAWGFGVHRHTVSVTLDYADLYYADTSGQLEATSITLGIAAAW